MSTNPLKETLNRGNQLKSNKGDFKQSVSLFDIDYAMMSYLEDTVLPTLDDNGKALKIPVIYGNSERWNGARRQGVFRDIHGKIQLPLLMIRRTSIAKDEAMPMLKRHVSYQGVTKYSKDNRYDRFTLLGTTSKPKYEIYKIQMPEYVEVNYECMGWTNFTEQLNQVIEQLNYTGQYWGDKDRFKFRTEVSEFNVVNEVGEGTERINRVEFNLNVKAYLLPEKFDEQSTIKKSMSTKKVVITTETDVTGNGRLEGVLTKPSPYYDNKDIIDWLNLNNSKILTASAQNIFITSDIKFIPVPSILSSTVGNNDNLKVYINGIRVYEEVGAYSKLITGNNLTITFDSGVLGYNVETTGYEVAIIGKFIDL
jgi:hypothetical protein